MVQAVPRAVLGAIVAFLLALAGCGDDDETIQRTEPETQRRVTELASVELADGRQVVLQSFGPDYATGPCLTLLGLDRYKRQCGRAPSERDPSQAGEPVFAEATAQLTPNAPLEVYGATSPDVVRVTLRYTTHGSAREQPAVLMRVSDADTLASAGIREPFGYFLAELPSDASNITATVFDSDGAEIGSDNYEQFRSLHPSGVHRRCPVGPPGRASQKPLRAMPLLVQSATFAGYLKWPDNRVPGPACRVAGAGTQSGCGQRAR